jgi:hypothetical protein
MNASEKRKNHPFEREYGSFLTKFRFLLIFIKLGRGCFNLQSQVGIISYIARENAKRMEHYNFDTSILNEYWTDSQSFVLMSAVIYIIAAIFKRGIAIQEENDLTV